MTHGHQWRLKKESFQIRGEQDAGRMCQTHYSYLPPRNWVKHKQYYKDTLRDVFIALGYYKGERAQQELFRQARKATHKMILKEIRLVKAELAFDKD